MPDVEFKSLYVQRDSFVSMPARLDSSYVPVWGSGASRTYLAYQPSAAHVGPLLTANCIYASTHLPTMLGAIDARLVPPPIPPVTPRSTAVTDGNTRFLQAFLRHCASPRLIRRAVLSCPLIQLIKVGAYSQQSLLEVIDEMLLTHHLPKRTIQCKFEVTCKGDKPPRLIINEGARRLICLLVLVHVVSELVFDEIHGLGRYSIKHQSKEFALNKLCSDFSAYPAKTVIFELDQTKFDQSERAQRDIDRITRGVLADERKLFEHVAPHLAIIINPMFRQMAISMEEMSGDRPNKLDFKKTRDSTQCHAPKVTFTVDGYTRFSGNLFTSAGNFFQELRTTASAFLLNPECLITGAQPIGLDGLPCPFRVRVEGDDLIAQTNRRYARFRKIYQRRIRSVGLQPKLLFVIDGRAEFCGTHFVSVQGKLVPRLWIPDVFRNLACSGTNVSKAVDKARAVASSFYMRARNFAGRSDGCYQYCLALADLHGSHLLHMQADLPSHELMRTFGTVTITLGEIRTYANDAHDGRQASPGPSSLATLHHPLRRPAEVNRVLTFAEQHRLFCTSLEAHIPHAVFAVFQAGGLSVGSHAGVDHAYDVRSVYAALPRVLYARFCATFVGGNLR